MKLSELYKVQTIHSKTEKFKNNDIEIKLFLDKEAEQMEGKEIHEQLAACIIEDGKTLLDAGCAEMIRDNMPLAHKKELMELIMSVNGISVSFDDVKKK